MRAIVCAVNNKCIFCDAKFIQIVQQITYISVMIYHCIVVT